MAKCLDEKQRSWLEVLFSVLKYDFIDARTHKLLVTVSLARITQGECSRKLQPTPGSCLAWPVLPHGEIWS